LHRFKPQDLLGVYEHASRNDQQPAAVVHVAKDAPGLLQYEDEN